MLIIPAIDIQDGCVVRFVQGRLNKKIYSRDPLKTAKHWVKQGAKFIHVVDLDGAIYGKTDNLGIVKEIARNVAIPIEFGGGIRDMGSIKTLLNSGINRVILGTKAVEDIIFLKKAFKVFNNKIIVSIDAKDNFVLIKGWRASSKGKGVFEFANTLKKIGFKELIYTDTLKDGTLKGPNIKGIRNLIKKTGLKVIASGGISSLDDIYRLTLLEDIGVIGIIIGKALYEGKFTLTAALKLS
jgi:phosphoribosylformimino-5-aminoimidazole carboxamide ribotide isomerase